MMPGWVIVDVRDEAALVSALQEMWRGSGWVARVTFAAKKSSRAVTVASPDRASATRSPKWPDVLTDWSEIHGEPLFPDDLLTAAAEATAWNGANAIACFAEPRDGVASVAWYRGQKAGSPSEFALELFEHVGGAAVAWSPEAELGRPGDGSMRVRGAKLGKKVAGLFVEGADLALLDRMVGTSRPTAETLARRAFASVLGFEPPGFVEINQLVSAAPRKEVGE